MNKKIVIGLTCLSILILISIGYQPIIAIDNNLIYNNKISNENSWEYYLSLPNYAPSGMPDFDQMQDNWYNDNRDLMLGCYAIAFANIIWYMDSLFSDSSGFPGDGNDTFLLVSDYGAPGIPNPGPFTDDHNFNNVNDLETPWDPLNQIYGNELVERIGQYVGNGYFNLFKPGLDLFISDLNLDSYFYVEIIEPYYTGSYPSFNDLYYNFSIGAGIALVIGSYDIHRVRKSGHVVTLAGINYVESKIAISDPSLDISNPTNDVTLHNDASIVSHDIYQISNSPFQNDEAISIDYSNYYADLIDGVVMIFPNQTSPYKPSISGPESGEIRVSYNYTFNSVDPDGDNLKFYIEWGNGEEWTEYIGSGENITISHTWDEEDNYTIRVKAVDVFDQESDWATLDISMPKTKTFNLHDFLINFFNDHPFIFPILKNY